MQKAGDLGLVRGSVCTMMKQVLPLCAQPLVASDDYLFFMSFVSTLRSFSSCVNY